MRRITVAALTTLSSLALLFSYPTSNGSAVAAGAVSVDPAAVPAATSADSPATEATEATAAASPSSSTSAARSAKATAASTRATATRNATKTYDGTPVNTRWGVVQVQITVSGGRITAARALQYPNDNGHDQEINAYALPILDKEVLSQQSGSIDAVSGATVTSDGYISSLQSALDAAHL